MTLIRTTCPRCGGVEVPAAAILLHAPRSDHEGTYSFTCPVCKGDVEKRADPKVVALLISAGVDPEDRRRHPSHIGRDQAKPEADEPHPNGPSLTLDHLIDFHFLLEDNLYIEESLQRFA